MSQIVIEGVKCERGYYSATDLIRQYEKKTGHKIVDTYNYMKRSRIRKSMQSFKQVTGKEPKRSTMGANGHVYVSPIVLINIYINLYKKLPGWAVEVMNEFIDNDDKSIPTNFAQQSIKSAIRGMFDNPNKKLLSLLNSIEAYNVEVSKYYYYISICLVLISDKKKAVELTALLLL